MSEDKTKPEGSPDDKASSPNKQEQEKKVKSYQDLQKTYHDPRLSKNRKSKKLR